MAAPGQRLSRARTGASTRWARLKKRRPWIGHVVEAYNGYKAHNGDHLAAAITYFSFLALFPLVLLGVSVAGFVLSHDQHLLTQLTHSISRNVPGDFGAKLQLAIDTAIKNRAGVGTVGLLGVALAGLGWIDNLRTAIDAVWAAQAKKQSFLGKKLSDTLVLAGLGLGVVLSLALTVGGTAATDSILRLLSLDGVTGVGVLARVIGIVLAVAGDLIIFGWLIIRLPDVSVSRTVALRTALLASVGFELLKISGTYYIARVSHSPTAGIFGSIVGTLIWIDLVSRFLLYCVAWAAAAEAPAGLPFEQAGDVRTGATSAGGASLTGGDQRLPGAAPPGRSAAAVFGVGAAVGAGALAELQRWRAARKG